VHASPGGEIAGGIGALNDTPGWPLRPLIGRFASLLAGCDRRCDDDAETDTGNAFKGHDFTPANTQRVSARQNRSDEQHIGLIVCR
jgi:hypothetical protein